MVHLRRPPQSSAHRPHPDGHRPPRRRRRALHELWSDGVEEVLCGFGRSGRGLIPMISDRLFVYGTLMRGFDHPMAKLLAGNAEFLGPAQCRGRLYLVKHYPGLVVSDDPADIVHGELFRLREREAMLREFDMYEACGEGFPPPTEYVREML